MAESNSCTFREYRGDIGRWWCVWKNGACDRPIPCERPPKENG